LIHTLWYVNFKRKTVRQTPNVVEIPTIEILPFILEHNQNAVIAADIIYVKKYRSLLLSQGIYVSQLVR
jgi:hypothetical protein